MRCPSITCARPRRAVSRGPMPAIFSPAKVTPPAFQGTRPEMSRHGSAAEIGTDDLLGHANFSRRPLRQYPAEIDHGHIVTDIENQICMMLDQKHASALTADCLDELPKSQDLVSG